MGVFMKLKIQDLLNELLTYSIVRSSNISSQAKGILSSMKTEFEKLAKSDVANKQSEMIRLFVGGTILALIQDDAKDRERNNFLFSE